MRIIVVFIIALFSYLIEYNTQKPRLFLIGDSTVKSGKGIGENNMWGWGSQIESHFDTSKIQLINAAIGGRSSRTFLTEGRWDPIISQLKNGDFLIVQFGHNDDWAINDTIRARGTIKGIGNDSIEIDNLITKKHETVYSFGWYLRKYAHEAKAKGAEVYLCSQVPFNKFENNKVIRKKEYYPKWTAEVAKQTKSNYIDLHELSAKVYDKLGYETVKTSYFTEKDNVHTNENGAKLNAKMVLLGISKTRNSKLKKYIKK
jgi:rhamnogalacturonan acetylesterase